MQAKLSIIIVNWNTREQLLDCLRSIERTTKENFILSSVVVVDNASIDNSIVLIEQEPFSFNVEIIKNAKNKGFAAACNQGAFLAKEADYLLFLNPDTKIYDKTLNNIFNFLPSVASDVGIIGVKQEDETGKIQPSCRAFPNLSRLFFEKTGLSVLFPKISTKIHDFDYQKLSEVDQIMGSFFLVKQSVFKQLNGFSENYFVYYEEVDFSYRAYQSGYKSLYFPNAIIFHKGGGASEQVKDLRLFYSLRSSLIYAKKHFS